MNAQWKNLGKIIFPFLLLWLGVENVLAQRVLEVETSIKEDIKDYVERVIPNTKYTLEVNVYPLRRKQAETINDTTSLPYMDLDNEYVVDEWDSPDTSLYTLYSRIKKVDVQLFIDSNVKLENKSDFISRLYVEAHLIPGRDTIVVDDFETVTIKEFNWKEYKDELLIGILLVSLFLFGYLISNIGLSLARRNTPSESSEKSVASAPVRNEPIISQRAESTVGSGITANLGGDFFIQDPTKINETVGKKIQSLLESPMFPTMSDMIILEQLAKSNIASFSYLVYEMPLEIQKKVYRYGRTQIWFQAFSQVGLPSKEVLTTLDLMLRDRTVHFSEDFEKFLIYSWRLEGNLSELLRDVQKDHAIKILAYLPKDMSIPVARSLFPGSWGNLFENSLDENFLSEIELKSLMTDAKRLKASFNFEALKEFKDRKDLLVYLDKVNPKEEREIYAVLGRDSEVESIRPPFFKLFDLKEDELKKLKSEFSLYDWSVALFNVDHKDRELIVNLLDDKEAYLFSEYLKGFSRKVDEAFIAEQVEIRKLIATRVSKYSGSKKDIEVKESIGEGQLNEVA